MTRRTTKILLSAFVLSAVMATGAVAQAQMAAPAASAPVPAPAPASAVEGSNKAGKPPVDKAASQANVANKKPAKAGAQSGPAPDPKK